MRGKRSVVVLAITAIVVGAIVGRQLTQPKFHLVHFPGQVSRVANHHSNRDNLKHPLASAGNGTLFLTGKMSSAATFTMTGALSVGHLQNLDWDLPLQTSMASADFASTVDPPSFAFDIQPDSSSDVMSDGHPARRFHWDNPPTNSIIHVTETVHISVHSNLSSFSTSASFPLKNVPASVQPYLALSKVVRLPEGATTTINQLTQGKSTERQVVESVGNWVATTMHYDATKGVEPYVDASYAFDNHAGTCRGYDSLMTGILRKLGIPVRTVNGWVTPQKLNLPGPRGGSSYVQWSIPGTAGELHTWIEIWFPDAGWVPFDPQREKFFVDVRHFPFFLSNDSGDQQIGAWTADTQDGQNSDGPLLPQGGTEIVPGDGINSKVTLNLSSGNVHIVAQGFHRDVHTLFMFEG